MTIVDKYTTASFDDVNFQLEAIMNRIVTLENNMNKALQGLPTPESIQAVLDDFNGKFVAAVQSAEQGQQGVETRMGDLERKQTSLDKQIIDTATALKAAPQDVLKDVIDAVPVDASPVAEVP